MIDKKSKIIFIVLGTLIAFSIGATFYKLVILKDYDRYYDDYGEDQGSELIE